MRSGRIEDADGIATRPDNWQDGAGEIGDLPIRRETIGDYVFMRSAWHPDTQELLRLIGGASVHLGISANQHPVVAMDVGGIGAAGPPVMLIRLIARADALQCWRLDMLTPGDPETNTATIHAHIEDVYDPDRIPQTIAQMVDRAVAKTLSVQSGLRGQGESS